MKLWTVGLLILLCAGCQKRPAYGIESAVWNADGMAFVLSDGRVFLVRVQDNPTYLQTDARRFKGLREVHFRQEGSETRIYLKGTGFLGLNDLSFCATEAKQLPGEGLIATLKRGY